MANPTKSYTPGTMPTIQANNSGRLYLSNQLTQISQLVNATQQQVTAAQADIGTLQGQVGTLQTDVNNPPLQSWAPIVSILSGQPGTISRLDTGNGVYIDVGPFRFVDFYSGRFTVSVNTYVTVSLPSNFQSWPVMTASEIASTGAVCSAYAQAGNLLLMRTAAGQTPASVAGQQYAFYVSGFYQRA